MIRTGQKWAEVEEDDEDAHEHDWIETVSVWPRGALPTADMLAALLTAEKKNIYYFTNTHCDLIVI